LIDHQNNLWPVLDKRLAYERVARYTEMAEIGSGAVKQGFLGATAGALIGAAIGMFCRGSEKRPRRGRGGATGASAGGFGYESNRVNQDISMI
jgi:hypothetical protein